MTEGAGLVRTRKRLVLIGSLKALLLFFLLLRLADIQLVKGARLHAFALKQQIEKVVLNPERGNIYDRDGRALAVSVLGSSVAAYPRLIKDSSSTARTLSSILEVPTGSILADLTSRSDFVWVARKIEDKRAGKIKALHLTGIDVIQEPTGKRIYPKLTLASHVLGFAGIDEQGLAGIEYAYDRTLRGAPGYLITEADLFGRAIPGAKGSLRPSKSGNSLILTLDETIQYVAERELARAIRKYGAKSGTAIVMEPRTGDVLAFANLPGFDCQNFSKSRQSVLRNRGITDSYEPGSVLKAVLIAAALDKGAVSLHDSFFCGSSILVDGWRIRNADDGLDSPSGREDLDGILTYSYNVGAVGVGLRLGSQSYHHALTRFGFGKTTGVDLPGEAAGTLPSLSEWKLCNLATISFGHGISVTPIQVVKAFGIIANQGRTMKPRLVRALAGKNGEAVETFVPSPGPRVITEETSRQVTRMLVHVVEKGTGKSARVKGYTVAGKTGTAQVIREGRYVPGKYVASFVGFVPAEAPRLVILVKIDEPAGVYWGGVVAAPVFREIATEALWRLGVPTSDQL
ncbi:MAG: hypothetical protein HYU64_10635 [Armatimonadetes bacterium]|nr:hypothetical protein [Armatimonadota bacterium]